MKYLIVSASSGLGKELAYSFAERNHDLILVSRDIRDLSALKSDIENKYKNNIEILSIDLSSNDEITKKLFIDRYFEDETYIYVCQNKTCQRPETKINLALEQVPYIN